MKNTFVLSTAAIMVVLLLSIGIGATNFITPAYAPEPARVGPPEPPSLTGVWRSSDGGTYYVRHIGDVVWWIGLSGGNDGRTYSNTFRGTITTIPMFGNAIEGEWVDVPRGTNMGAGKMGLDITGLGSTDSPLQLYKISDSAGFGPDVWTKLK
jgi:hypothetical protein